MAVLALQGISGDAVIAPLKVFVKQAPSQAPQGCYAIARGEAERLLAKMTE